MIMMERVATIDPVALWKMGLIHFNDGDHDTAFEYWTKATGLGDMASHYNLSLLYRDGHGVEKDEKMEVYHLWNRLPFAGIHLRDSILQMLSGTMVGKREQ